MTRKPVTTTFLSSATEAWGAEESLLSLAQRLPDHGIAPILKTANAGLAARWDRAVGTPAQVIRSSPTSPLSAAASWSRHIPTDGNEVCVIFNIALIPAAAITRLTRWRPPALILDLHDYLPSKSGRAKLRVGAHAFDAVVSVSRFSASQISHRSNTVLTRPIDRAPSPERGLRVGSHRIGIIGRIDPDKNLEMVIDAASLLPSNVSLVVRGDSTSHHAHYRDSVLNRGRASLGNRFQFDGRVPRTEVLHDLDALIVSNASEALGRTILEAQLAGIPVVVPDKGGAAELVHPHKTGFVFEAGSTEDLANSIALALAAPAELLEDARDFAAISTDPHSYADAYARVITTAAR